jgi:hypothetical protein
MPRTHSSSNFYRWNQPSRFDDGGIGAILHQCLANANEKMRILGSGTSDHHGTRITLEGKSFGVYAVSHPRAHPQLVQCRDDFDIPPPPFDTVTKVLHESRAVEIAKVDEEHDRKPKHIVDCVL